MSKKQPIRIAEIIGKWVGGGVETVVMNYYRQIDRSKIQFDFICDDDSINIPYEEIESLGGRVILIPPYQKVFYYQKKLIEVLKKNKYKIIHSHINTLSIFSLRAAKKAGVPVRIAHSHSTTNKKEWKKNAMKSVLKYFSKVYATNYFACTEYAGRWLFGNKIVNNGELFVLSNAIDLEKFRFNETIRNKKREELGLSSDTFVVGNIGRFVTQKNHTFLIDIYYEICNINKNSVLLLVGQGPLMKEIEKKVKELNLSKNVIFLGQRTDVNELYQAFDCFLFPSLYEGLGIVTIESQCSGCQTVTSTNVPAITKVTDKITYLSLDEKSEVWANTVINQNKVKNRISYINEIQSAGYDICKEVKNLEEFYLNINERSN